MVLSYRSRMAVEVGVSHVRYARADPKQRCVHSDLSINTLNGTFPASWSSLSTLEELCVL